MKRSRWRSGRSLLAIASAIATCPLLAPPVGAELSWESTAIFQTVIPGDTTATTEFRFTNTGRHSVNIIAVRPSCDCTTYDLNKMQYEVGEAGAIKLRLKIGASRGTIDRTVDVVYEDTALAMQTLRWSVRIPEPVIIKPDTVVWRPGEMETKVIGIARAGAEPITVSKVECSSESFVWRLVTLHDSDAYELRVMPQTYETRGDAVIRIMAGAPNGESWHEVRVEVR